jgi:RNA polymerase sigma factor for flagellar operon FliA
MSSGIKTTDQLIEECQGLVKSLAWKARAGLPHSVDIDDLIGYGQIGLSEAAKAYDPTRGVKFSTFAYYRVRGAIFDGLTMMSWFRRSPSRDVKFDQMANEVLEEQSGETSQSNTTSLGNDGRWLKDLSASLAVVYLAGDRSEGQPESQVVDASMPTPQAEVSQDEVHDRLTALVDSLSGQEGALIRAAYYEGLSLTDAARRIGVSKSWASRLHAQTLKRLAHSLREAGIVD